MPTDTEDLVSRLRNARTIVVLTGSGVSAASGIPTFRGDDGLWRTFRAEELATPEAFAHDPKTVWEWYDWRRTTIASSQPNAAHTVLAKWSQRPGFTLITQNVDGLHQRAGLSPARVIEIHGTMRQVVCLSCGEQAPTERALARVRAGEADPPCRSCGGILKTATVSFGQPLMSADLARAQAAARRCDMMLAVGTKLSVWPIAGVVPVAKEAGARVVIVNAEPTEMDQLADAMLAGPISELLPRLVGE
jgi:NAD-dependent protein deacetylase/lipoamidase